jgi:hypothetical protein
MGMAASQARFLQLTARRTNIEYMGQQINQQRLALANASAGLFERMLSMVPPTPPSSQDDKYYTQGYKFTDPADDIQKTVKWSSVIPDAGDFTIGSINFVGPSGNALSTFTLNAAALASFADGTGPDINDLSTALGIAPTQAQTDLGYTQVIRNVTIEHNIYDPDGNYRTVEVNAPALLVFDNLNRLLNFSVLNQATIDAQPAATTNKPDTIGAGESLTYSGQFDDVAYNDDMNKYEFAKATYDYQIERINQETRVIQSQDKSLELKMKQLDTEHNAVQTEMEAVQKVISKNIEGSFKTFA